MRRSSTPWRSIPRNVSHRRSNSTRVQPVLRPCNVNRNNGCPCPGIGDAALGITDVVLHFFYNLIAYAAILPAFYFVVRRGGTAGATVRATLHV